MRRFTWMLAACGVIAAPANALAATYYVAPNGDDAAAGTMAAPWGTLQHASDQVAAGDTVMVEAGTYVGFDCRTSGTAQAPITFSAADGVLINAPNPKTPDGVNIEDASYVVVEGFTVNGLPRTGLRTAVGDHITFRKNKADKNGEWGILTGHVDDLLIEQNEMSNSIGQHGIYVGNSAKRPIVRYNRIWGNTGAGLHMNGDISQGGDGIIEGAVIEGNVIYSNGAAGGSAINCDGVRTSLFQNNLIWDEHGSGISLYQGDAGGASINDVVVNNTVIQSADGRWALNLQNGSTGTLVYNNIFLNLNPGRGAIDLTPECKPGFLSDYNVVVDRFTLDDGDSQIPLAVWTEQTGQDAHSLTGDAATLFVDQANHDYHLAAGSPAIDKGTAMKAPAVDLDGNPRPIGGGFDIGAYELCAGNCMPATTSSAGATSGATSGAGVGSTGVSGAGAGGAGASTGSGADTGGAGGGGQPGKSGGCGCRIAGGDEASGRLAALAVAALAAACGRRRRRG